MAGTELDLTEVLQVVGDYISNLRSVKDNKKDLIDGKDNNQKYVRRDQLTNSLFNKLKELDNKTDFSIEDQIELYYDKDIVTKEQAVVLLKSFETFSLSPQYDRDGNMYLNPRGSVSRAEAINALALGGLKGKSIDGVSSDEDYYNSGYNELVSDENSNFYRVYTRDDLGCNIRRLELAYMIYSHSGYNFGKDFKRDDSIQDLRRFNDIKKLPVMLNSVDNLKGLLPRGKNSIEDFIYNVRTGKEKLPIDLILITSDLMLLIKGKVDLSNLYPLKGVSRLEFSYLMESLKKDK